MAFVLRIAPLLVACLLLSGCFVFDEIDAGMEMMNKGKKAEAEAPPEEAEPGPPTGSAWWSSAKSFTRGPANAEPEDAGDPKALVSCRIGGGTRFMRRGDCASQGGTPKG